MPRVRSFSGSGCPCKDRSTTNRKRFGYRLLFLKRGLLKIRSSCSRTAFRSASEFNWHVGRDGFGLAAWLCVSVADPVDVRAYPGLELYHPLAATEGRY